MMEQATAADQQERIEQLKDENKLLRSALETTRCGRELLRQQKEFSLLLHVSNVIVSELDIKKVLELVADKARDLVDADLLLVPLLDNRRQQYTYSAASGEGAKEILGQVFKLHTGMCGWVLRNERSLLFGEDSIFWIEEKPAWEEGQQSALLVPLFGRKKIIGGLSALGKKGGGSFSRHDLDLLTMYANQVSIAIENANLFKEWHDTIAELTREIHERKQVEESLQILFKGTVHQVGQDFFDNLTELLCQFFGCECAIVGNITESDTVESISMVVEGKHIHDFSYQLSGSPCEHAARQGFCHYETDLLRLFPNDVELARLQAVGYIGSPIKNKLGKPIGILCALSRSRLELPKGSENVMNILAARTAAEIDRLQMEKRIQNSLQSLNDAQRIANLGHHEQNLLTSESVWSDSLYRLFGYEPGEIDSSIETFWSFVHKDDLGAMQAAYEEAFAKGTLFDYEFRAVTKNGEIRHLHALGECVADRKKRPVNYRGTLQDITEQVKTEKELLKVKKLETIGVLAGGIAHDFNNILTAILGNINLALVDDELKDRTRKLLSEAEKASLVAKKLTQQLLTFAKGGEPVKAVSSLEDVIRDSAGFVLHGNRVECRFSLPNDLWLVDIDKGQISQVIQNIVLNASHAMQEGGTISITGENITGGGENDSVFLHKERYVKISIRDSGIGIPANALEKIFDPYFSTKREGSGLGLAITLSIINKHGGHIAAESSPGVGSTFTLYLPASDGLKKQATTLTATDVPSTRAKILLMDDEEMLRDVAGAMLRQLGHAVKFSINGEEAVRMYREAAAENKPFDLVLMDLTIPGGMGGREAVQKILDFDPTARVIVSSGYSTDPIMADFSRYGFCSAIVKPYQLHELSRVLGQILQ